MKRVKRRRDGQPIDFWESATDLSLVLLLVLLLIIALLLLYTLQLPEDEWFQLWGTQENLQEREDDDRFDGNEDEWYGDEDDHDDHDDGGGDGDGEEEDEFHERYPIPTTGGEDWSKAAVYVTVIDAETKRAIREPDIDFELYEEFDAEHPDDPDREAHGAIRYLNTYYPEKIEYHDYKTREDGSYFLPEKIEQGWYYLKELTAPEGYDSAGTINFDVDDSYDWNDPFVVSVPLYPAKNVIRVKLVDADSGEVLSSGKFQVDAAEDIITIDDTVRYQEGAQADEFSVDEEGIGISKELYLGKYLVKQSAAPLYYTTVDDEVETLVEKKNGKDPEELVFYCQKTEILIHLADDLSGQPIAGAGFALMANGTTVESGETDEKGVLSFGKLDKNVTYTVKQTSSAEGYQLDTEERTYLVDETGHIEGNAKVDLQLRNYIPRTEIALRDILLHTAVSGKNLSLYDSSGKQLHTWTTGSTPESVTNLSEGSYYILREGRESSRYDFTVTDSGEVTSVEMMTWSTQSILAIVAGVIAVPLGIYLIVLLLKRASGGKGEKKPKKQGKPQEKD